MSIERDAGQLFAQCDHCSNAEELEADDFQEAVSEMKQDGWLITKLDGEWVHLCPSCKEEL